MDRKVVEQLFAQYGWANDSKDFSVLDEVFTEDATFTIEIAGVEEPVGPFEGRQAIVEFISGAVSEQTDRRRHVITNFREEPGGVTAILSLFVTDNGELTAQATGLYRVTLADEGGATRFSSMHLALDRGW